MNKQMKLHYVTIVEESIKHKIFVGIEKEKFPSFVRLAFVQFLVFKSTWNVQTFEELFHIHPKPKRFKSTISYLNICLVLENKICSSKILLSF